MLLHRDSLLHFSGSVMVGVDPRMRRSIARDGGWGVCFVGMEFWGMDPILSGDET